MSVYVTNLVWQSTRATHSALLVLLAIADYADDQGRAYPSVQTLSTKTRLSERQVRSALKELEESREITIQKNAGPCNCNVYFVASQIPEKRTAEATETAVGGANSAPAEIAGVQSLHVGGANSAPGGVQSLPDRGANSAPKPSGNRQIEPSEEPSAFDPDEPGERKTADTQGEESKPKAKKAAEPKTEPEAKRRSRVPASFQPSDAVLAWAAQKHPSVSVEIELPLFLDYHKAKGTLMADWQAAFRTWVRNSEKFANQRNAVGQRGGFEPAATTTASYHKPADVDADFYQRQLEAQRLRSQQREVERAAARQNRTGSGASITREQAMEFYNTGKRPEGVTHGAGQGMAA